MNREGEEGEARLGVAGGVETSGICSAAVVPTAVFAARSAAARLRRTATVANAAMLATPTAMMAYVAEEDAETTPAAELPASSTAELLPAASLSRDASRVQQLPPKVLVPEK